jgi:hypothetical protein
MGGYDFPGQIQASDGSEGNGTMGTSSDWGERDRGGQNFLGTIGQYLKLNIQLNIQEMGNGILPFTLM